MDKNKDEQVAMREVAEQAARIHKQMKRQIDAVTAKCIRFNAAYEWEDYYNEAYLAIYDAVLRFSPAHAVQCNRDSPRASQMQLQTFAQWFIQKRLFKMADVREICYNVYQDNTCVDILTNTEYRKNKKALEEKGFVIRSTRNTYRFSELASIREGKVLEFDPAMPEPETEEVRKWIKVKS